MEEDLSDDYEMDPTLKSIIEKDTLNWIFVGGKGGVGKTTTSCSIALLLAKKGKRVLLISTDPAHNLSDAFNQKINETPTTVVGCDNLQAMEISPKKAINEIFKDSSEGIVVDLVSSIPGIDEAISFAELMRQVQKMTHDVIIFDTAPTGHTLKFLGFPGVLEKGVKKVIELRNKFGGLIEQMRSIMGKDDKISDAEKLLGRLEETKDVIEKVNDQFKDSKLTTFVCVCIPEFLSVYETSRLIEVLRQYQINCETLIVNQVLFPQKDSNCKKCLARVKMQRKYLLQINVLFDTFNIVTTPLLDEEIRGIPAISNFAKFLLKPYENES